MLIVTRKLNETITIDPVDGLDPDMPLSEAFKDGAIQIKLLHIAGRRIRIAIEAPRQLRIWRGPHEARLGAMPDGQDQDRETDELDASAGGMDG